MQRTDRAWTRPTETATNGLQRSIARSCASSSAPRSNVSSTSLGSWFPYVAKILFSGEPTKFRFEGYCRAALRRGMILQEHYSWRLSDALADMIVKKALASIGARRPNWAEGQREYTAVPGFAPAERFFASDVRRPMPEGRRLYCSRSCVATRQQRTEISRAARDERGRARSDDGAPAASEIRSLRRTAHDHLRLVWRLA